MTACGRRLRSSESHQFARRSAPVLSCAQMTGRDQSPNARSPIALIAALPNKAKATRDYGHPWENYNRSTDFARYKPKYICKYNTSINRTFSWLMNLHESIYFQI